jgi:hypothetical protein
MGNENRPWSWHSAHLSGTGDPRPVQRMGRSLWPIRSSELRLNHALSHRAKVGNSTAMIPCRCLGREKIDRNCRSEQVQSNFAALELPEAPPANNWLSTLASCIEIVSSEREDSRESPDFR